MRYRTPEAFRAALDQRLKNEAATAGVALMRLRKRVAFERFLARLSAAESEGWMLTGAFALDLRLGLGTRTTKDIDLARADHEEAATEHLSTAGAIDLGDFFDFEVRRAGALDPVAGVRAVRYTVRAELAGRRFEQFPVDVALGEHGPNHAQRLRAPDLLAFAEIDAPEIPMVPLERQRADSWGFGTPGGVGVPLGVARWSPTEAAHSCRAAGGRQGRWMMWRAVQATKSCSLISRLARRSIVSAASSSGGRCQWRSLRAMNSRMQM